MKLFEILGRWVGGLFLMALGGAWLAAAYYLNGFGAGATPTVLGLGVIGGALFVFGLFGVVRGIASLASPAPLPEGSTGWRDDGERGEGESDFDPDAAIARYLQNRPAPDSGEPAPAAEA